MSNNEQKKTPEVILAGAMMGEQVLWTTCPCCKKPLAVYIRTDTVRVALGPMIEVDQSPHSTHDTECSSESLSQQPQ